MHFTTGEELLALCREQGKPMSQIMLEREVSAFGSTVQEIHNRMAHSYAIMKQAAKQSLENPQRSMGGLIGGEAKRLYDRGQQARPVCGSVVSKAVSYAMGALEVNASMGLIVAAPTAGSCGVIPGAYLAVQEEFELTDEAMLQALYNASAVGYLITYNATVAGAEGGCQAEVGSASAMAASGIVELLGGAPAQCLAAASFALCNLMGLICDPVGGLVEAPCQQRNAIGASNALICAESALSGIESLVPFDQVVDAMYRVGQSLPRELRETALGGIAATPAGCAACPMK